MPPALRVVAHYFRSLNRGLTAVISPARLACYRVLQAIELHGAFSDEALHGEALSRLKPVDRNLATEIILGTLRRQCWLDYLLRKASARPWPQVDTHARILLRMSLYQLAFTGRLPDYAVVNDAVELAKRGLKRGADSFVNAVLRHLGRDRPWEKPEFQANCPPWVQVSLPKWLWQRWLKRFGHDTAYRFARSLNNPPARAFWLRRLEARADIPFALEKSAVVPGAFMLQDADGASTLQSGGDLHFQDEASQLIPHLLGSVEGWRIWDACAAPGGKCAIFCHMVGTSGLVVGSDISLERTGHLRHFLASTQCGNTAAILADAAAPAPFRTPFDAVAVDAPCSGLGTMRRNPEIKWRFSPKQFPKLRQIQLEILSRASHAVRRGGYLLYSTCSTEPEENEQVVDAFLDSNRQFRLQHPASPPGIVRFVDDRGFFRSFPGERMWDGFFAALMARIS